MLGPDLVVWTTNFWLKEPGGAEIPWHQDINFWPIEPPVNVSAWIAIDEVTAENACVRIIPGSHRQFMQHGRAPDEMAIAEMVDPAAYDASQAVNMELKPGEFFLFSERLLHASAKKHFGQAPARLVRPRHRALRAYLPGQIICIPGTPPSSASGKDVMGFNRYAGRPEMPAKSEL